MKRSNIIVLLICCMVIVSLSGCALLALPGQIIGGVFKLIGQALQVAGKLPKPPPGVF